MIFHAAYCVLFLLLSSLGYAADGLSFFNLSKNYDLVASGNAYEVVGSDIKVSLSNRMIVKVKPPFDKSEFKRVDNHITDVVDLYYGDNFQYLMLKLSSESDLSRMLHEVRLYPGVILVQPDMIQHRTVMVTGKQAPDPSQSWPAKQTMMQKKIALLTPSNQHQTVRVAIIDDGFDFSHPDFSRTHIAFQYDTETQTLDASPKNIVDGHGTKISGILFAAGSHDNVDGMVPDAQLIAIRQPNSWTSQTLLAFQLAKLAGADVINCSWRTQWLVEPVKDVVQDLANNGRDGKGIAVVFAAGNDGVEIQPDQYESSIPEAIVIGAYDPSTHARARYSNWGATVDAFFDGSAHVTTANDNRYARINGTSLAAAMATAVITDLLAKQPGMSVPDIEKRLANSVFVAGGL